MKPETYWLWLISLALFCFDIISHKQAAYLKGDSTVSQLLYIVHNIQQNWANRKITHGVFLDVSSAFDKVWHNGLIAKLSQIGIDGFLLQTIRSYLSGRKQVVVVDNIESETLEIIAGVPQGSILRPLLFNIFINDLLCFVKETEICNYADDNTLYACDVSIEAVKNRLVPDVLRLSDWFRINSPTCGPSGP